MWGKALQPSAIQMRTQMTNNRLIKHNKLTFYCNKLIQFLSLDISKREKKTWPYGTYEMFKFSQPVNSWVQYQVGSMFNTTTSEKQTVPRSGHMARHCNFNP